MSRARYDFRCQKCGQVIEIQKKMADPNPTKHKGCGGKLTRVWSVPKIAFIGGGYYSTGNR